MKKEYLIGVDLGTSGTKAAIYRTDGTMVAEDTIEVPIYYPKPGVVEQENDDFYDTAAKSVRNCISKSGIEAQSVAAITFDSQMAGIGSIDEDFKPVTRYDSWLDMRCEPYIEEIKKQAGDLVTRLTGCPPICDHGPKILWWKNERPEDYKRIVKFVTPCTYVAGRMAGLKADQAFIDYTIVHFSGYNDAQNGIWSQEICDKFGIAMEKLPQIVEPWRVIGEVGEKAAKDFWLVPGTPIAAGSGDQAANALGAGIVYPGILYDAAGTAAVLSGCTDRYIVDVKYKALLSMRSVIPGLWNPMAFLGGGGLALRWFRDEFFNTSRGQVQPIDEDLYEQMTAMAEKSPPGADGLLFSPHLGGRICPAAPAMRGVWIGFSWGHSQAHFFRAVLESIAFEYAYYLKIIKELVPELKLVEARAISGGARSRAWNQIKANILNVPYQRLKRTEFGTWGSALIAGKAVGIFDDLAEEATRSTLPDGKPIRPEAQYRALYDRMIDKYIHLQETLVHHFQE